MFMHFGRGRYFESDSGGGSGNGNGSGSGSGGGQGGGNAGGSGDEGKRSFTQKELDALFAERGKQGASAREKELLETLGVATLDEAKAKLAAAQAAEDAQKTELQKAQDAAAAEKTAREKAEQEKADALAKAAEKLMRAAVIAAATTAGFNDPNDAWLYADRTKIKAKDDDTFEGVKEAVEAVVKAKPYLAAPPKRPIGTPATGAKGKTPESGTQSKRPALRL